MKLWGHYHRIGIWIWTMVSIIIWSEQSDAVLLLLNSLLISSADYHEFILSAW